MKTLGDSMGKYLSLLIFKIILVLFIVLTVGKQVVHISVESIFGLSAHQKENLEKLKQSLIGKHITEVALNSNPMLTFGEKNPWTDLYLASIQQKDSVTTKKPNNFF
jgi:hypothetical protein